MGRAVVNRILAYLYFFILLIVFPAISYSQDNGLLERKVSVEVDNESVETILKQIEEQSGVNFSYESMLLLSVEKQSLNLDNIAVRDILDVILFNTGLEYSCINEQVVIFAGKDFETPVLKENKPIAKPSVAIPRVTTDTVYKIHTDTVILLKTDTVFKNLIDTVILIESDTIIRFINIKTSIFNRYNSHWSMRLSYQTNAFSSSYSKLHPGNEFIYNEIKNSESPTISFATFLSAVYTFGNYNLGAGIGYNQINEGVLFDYSIFNVDTLSNITGDSGHVILTDTTENYYSGNNKYKYITLPLSAGFRLCITPKLYAGAEVYLYLNYLVSSHGMTLSKSGEIEDVKSSDHRKITANIFVNPFLEYDFLNGISVYISPNIGWQLNSDYKKTFYYEKKRLFYGATLGLQYNF